MSDDKIGYGKPPKASRFKPGVSGNPKGRPKRKQLLIAEVVNSAIDAPIEFVEGGRRKVTTRQELSLRKWVERAVKGDIRAAAEILKIREQAQRDGEPGLETIKVNDWLSDYPGQSAEQKTHDASQTHDGDALKWWESEQGDQPESADPRPGNDVPSASELSD